MNWDNNWSNMNRATHVRSTHWELNGTHWELNGHRIKEGDKLKIRWPSGLQETFMADIEVIENTHERVMIMINYCGHHLSIEVPTTVLMKWTNDTYERKRKEDAR